MWRTLKPAVPQIVCGSESRTRLHRLGARGRCGRLSLASSSPALLLPDTTNSSPLRSHECPALPQGRTHTHRRAVLGGGFEVKKNFIYMSLSNAIGVIGGLDGGRRGRAVEGQHLLLHGMHLARDDERVQRAAKVRH